MNKPTTDDYRNLCACLYQAAGVYNLPERFLDALSNAQSGEAFSDMIEDLLPVCLVEVEEAALEALKMSEHTEIEANAEASKSAVEPVVMREPAPANNLPDWSECRQRVENSEYVEKRIAEGGFGFEEDGHYANELHRFIYEYDDADRYRSAWFLHRLEKLIEFVKADS